MNYEYTDSGIEWIGNIPNHWKTKRVKDISDYVQTGKTPPSSKGDFFTNGSINWFTPVDLDNELIVYSSKRKILQKSIENKFVPYFKKNTILFVGIGATVGKVSKIVNNASCNQQINAILFSTKMYHQYGLYYMLITGREIKKFASFVTLPIFTQTDTKQLQIIVPPFKEQKYISTYLDNACENIDKTIQSKEQQIIKINDYFYSSIHETVTKGLNKSTKLKSTDIECIGDIPVHWNIAKIKQKYSVIPSSVNKKSKDTEVEVQLCNYTDVYYKDYITNDIDFMIATAKDNECEKFKLNIDDVIITKDSEDPSDIAVPALVEEVQDNLLCGYHLSMIRAKLGNVSGRYLFWLLKDKAIVSQLHREATGITRWAISQRNIKNTIIPNPPLKEQIQIADYLEKTADRVNKIKEKLQAQIDTLKEYRISLIHECVTGKKQIYKGS